MGRILILAVVVAGLLALSGGQNDDPRTPPAAPGHPPPFLGTAVVGSGGLTGAVDAYGGLVDLRSPGPAGEAQIRNSADRQRVGTVPADTGITVAAASGERPPAPLWTGKRLRQQYLEGTNVLRTAATVAGARVRITDAATRTAIVRRVSARAAGERVSIRLGIHLDPDSGLGCVTTPDSSQGESLVVEGRSSVMAELSCASGPAPGVERTLEAVVRQDRRWLARARPLGRSPPWARRLYERSLLVLRALTDASTGAMAAGPRDHWALVWPRDAGIGAIALRAAGYTRLAERIAAFLADRDPDAAARFRGDGSPVGGRAAAGDAAGWISVGGAGVVDDDPRPRDWTDKQDYQELRRDSGDYLANAIASGAAVAEIRERFATARGLVRTSGDPSSGLDSVAAWAVRPFHIRELEEPVRKTLLSFAREAGRYGIRPSEGFSNPDAWTAPTAWSAWSLAALGEEAAADRLLRRLQRTAAPTGTLPERVDRRTGVALSTTPLAWSHAFAALALRERYG